MILRYWMRNKKLGVAAEAEFSDEGWRQLCLLRHDPRFKRCRIKKCYQALPSTMPPLGTVYELTN